MSNTQIRGRRKTGEEERERERMQAWRVVCGHISIEMYALNKCINSIQFNIQTDQGKIYCFKSITSQQPPIKTLRIEPRCFLYYLDYYIMSISRDNNFEFTFIVGGEFLLCGAVYNSQWLTNCICIIVYFFPLIYVQTILCVHFTHFNTCRHEFLHNQNDQFFPRAQAINDVEISRT